MDTEMNKKKIGKIGLAIIAAITVGVIAGGVLGIIAVASGIPVEILEETPLHIVTDYEEATLYPAVIKINDNPKEYRIDYEIKNYGSKPIEMVLYSRFPDEVHDGYKPYLFNEQVYLIFPEKFITIEGGETYGTEIIIGFPEKAAITSDIEMWIGFRSRRQDQNMELISKILLEKGGN